MSRLRWGLGALIGVVALVAAFRALHAYLDHHLWLGSLSVLTLAAIDVGGFAILGQARRRIGRELALLDAPSAGGELYAARRRRLEAIKNSGATPDLDALAQAESASEAGRAYLGRYFVAVTVLVGLVGTFAGLMETLHAMAPLLGDQNRSTLELLAAPLAGLDVTFGASVVAIVVTLALSLVQGDLVLVEELALARLEERTTHELVPALWPPSESAAERAAHELSALRRELGGFLGAAAEQSAERVAKVAATEVDRLVREVVRALDGATHNTAESSRRAGEAISAAAELAARSLADAGAAQASAQERLLEGARNELAAIARVAGAGVEQAIEALRSVAADHARVADSLRAAHDQSARDVLAQLTRSSSEQSAVIAALVESHEGSSTRSQRALEALAEEQAELGTRMTREQGQLAAQLITEQRALAALLTSEQRALAAHLTGEQGALASRLAGEQSQLASRLADDQAQHAGNLLEAQIESTRAAQAQLARLTAEHAARLEAGANAVAAAVRESLGGDANELRAAGATLAEAAAALRRGLESFAPPIERLAPELSALAREVALLASRGEPEEQAAALDELVRVGEGVDRLEALLRIARGDPPEEA